MQIVELTERDAIARVLSDDPIDTLEALDESILGVDGLVSVFAPEGERPANWLAVRWGQKALGLGSVALLHATRLSELEPLLEAFPADRGLFDLSFPFWASPGVASALIAEPSGIEARYRVDSPRLKRAPARAQVTRLDDPRIIRSMFPKLAADTPAYVLALRDALVAVAAVTHLQGDVARVHAYTTEGSRGHGFGRAVLTALAEELLALHIRPTATINLAHEPSVRLVESAGFLQHSARLKAQVRGRRLSDTPGPGLVGLGGR